jgi:hypothetical protein
MNASSFQKDLFLLKKLLEKRRILGIVASPDAKQISLRHQRFLSFGIHLDIHTWNSVYGGHSCIMDYFSSQKDVPRSHEKFLLYNPQPGLVNQKMALQDAAHFSRRLNRTLVVPPLLIDGRMRLGSEVFDLESLNHRTMWIDSSKVILPKPSRFVNFSLKDRFLETFAVNTFFDSLNLSMRPFEMHLLKYSDELVSGLFGGCQDDTLTFSTMFYTSNVSRVPEFPAWKSSLLSLSETIAESLRPFSCVHIRRGDFEDYCKYVIQKRTESGSNVYKAPFFANLSMENCFPDLFELSECLDSSSLLKTRKLYIATNEKDQELILQSFGRFFELIDTNQVLEDRGISEELFHVFDQLLCRRADVFVGNFWSTFSWSIAENRLQESYFINHNCTLS